MTENKTARRRPGGGEQDVATAKATSTAYCNTNPGTSQTSLVYDAKGRRVASVRGDVLCVTLHSSRGHLLQRPPGPGLAFNVEVLERAEALGATHVVIRDADTGRRYEANLVDFRAHGIQFDFGFGNQVCLRLEYWQVSEPVGRQLVLTGLEV